MNSLPTAEKPYSVSGLRDGKRITLWFPTFRTAAAVANGNPIFYYDRFTTPRECRALEGSNA